MLEEKAEHDTFKITKDRHEVNRMISKKVTISCPVLTKQNLIDMIPHTLELITLSKSYIHVSIGLNTLYYIMEMLPELTCTDSELLTHILNFIPMYMGNGIPEIPQYIASIVEVVLKYNPEFISALIEINYVDLLVGKLPTIYAVKGIITLYEILKEIDLTPLKHIPEIFIILLETFAQDAKLSSTIIKGMNKMIPFLIDSYSIDDWKKIICLYSKIIYVNPVEINGHYSKAPFTYFLKNVNSSEIFDELINSGVAGKQLRLFNKPAYTHARKAVLRLWTQMVKDSPQRAHYFVTHRSFQPSYFFSTNDQVYEDVIIFISVLQQYSVEYCRMIFNSTFEEMEAALSSEFFRKKILTFKYYLSVLILDNTNVDIINAITSSEYFFPVLETLLGDINLPEDLKEILEGLNTFVTNLINNKLITQEIEERLTSADLNSEIEALSHKDNAEIAYAAQVLLHTIESIAEE